MYPKAKVLGIVSRGAQILVEEFYGKHSKGEGLYYRPIGGSIEFGEKSDRALVREYYEELKVEIKIVNYFGSLENIFKIDKDIGHEIIQLYAVKFVNETNYERETFTVVEGNKSSIAKWLWLDEFASKHVLYPDGLLEKLTLNHEVFFNN